MISRSIASRAHKESCKERTNSAYLFAYHTEFHIIVAVVISTNERPELLMPCLARVRKTMYFFQKRNQLSQVLNNLVFIGLFVFLLKKM